MLIRPFAIAAILTAPVTAQVPSRSVAVARIDSIASAMLAAPVSGFQVAVVKGRDTLVMKGYGMANIELGVPVTPTTVFRIGSVTKQFTSAAIMQLVEQRKIALEDSLPKYMPNVPSHWRAVTIQQLLNHSSGIPSYTDVGSRMSSVFRTGIARDSLLAMFHHDSLVFPPGWGFYYNNTGYYILGMLIEKLAGKTYAAYIEDHFAKPLNLEGTMYCGTRPIIRGRAAGYDAQGGTLVNTSYTDMELPYAAGSICSTARDLVTWAHALASGDVVSAESYRTMTTPVKRGWVHQVPYGFGLMTTTLAGRRVVEHGGNINGFNAQLAHYPDDSLYVGVITNTSGGAAVDLAQRIARVVLGLPAATPIVSRDEPVTAAERAMLVGRYSMVVPDGTRRDASIREQGGVLVFEVPGMIATQKLRRQEGFNFAMTAPGRLIFDVRAGKVAGFVLDRGMRPLPGYKVP